MQGIPWHLPHIWGEVQRWRALPPVEQCATLEAATTLVLTRAIVFGPLSKPLVNRVLLRSEAHGTTPVADRAETIPVIQRAIARVSHRLGGCTCLVQALAGWMMLRRRGVEANLQVGVDKSGGRFAAHAWLEVHGVVVVGGARSQAIYTALRSVSADKAAMSV